MHNIQELYEDYLETDDVFTDEPQKITRLKYIIFHKLTEPERRIILLYTELQSIRKVAKLLNVSPASAWISINDVKTKIKKEYGNNTRDTTTFNSDNIR